MAGTRLAGEAGINICDPAEVWTPTEGGDVANSAALGATAEDVWVCDFS
jgi:hypothetical protein